MYPAIYWARWSPHAFRGDSISMVEAFLRPAILVIARIRPCNTRWKTGQAFSTNTLGVHSRLKPALIGAEPSGLRCAESSPLPIFIRNTNFHGTTYLILPVMFPSVFSDHNLNTTRLPSDFSSVFIFHFPHDSSQLGRKRWGPIAPTNSASLPLLSTTPNGAPWQMCQTPNTLPTTSFSCSFPSRLHSSPLSAWRRSSTCPIGEPHRRPTLGLTQDR